MSRQEGSSTSFESSMESLGPLPADDHRKNANNNNNNNNHGNKLSKTTYVSPSNSSESSERRRSAANSSSKSRSSTLSPSPRRRQQQQQQTNSKYDEETELIKEDLQKALREEQMLISLQMQMVSQLEKLKSSIATVESDAQLAKLATEQAQVARLLKRTEIENGLESNNNDDDDEVLTIEVRS